MRRVTALALATGGALVVGAAAGTWLRRPMRIPRALIAQGVKPSGALGWVVATTMPLLFHSLYAGIATALELRPDDDVLDVACGSGVFLHKYASLAHRIAGIDHSEVAIRSARRRNRERIRNGSAEIVQGDAAALPWADDSFSAVTSDCLGCFAEPLRSVKEMYRVLRPGGRMVLSIDAQPDTETARRSERDWGLAAWTEPELRSMIAEAGFPRMSVSHDKTSLFVVAVKPQREPAEDLMPSRSLVSTPGVA